MAVLGGLGARRAAQRHNTGEGGEAVCDTLGAAQDCSDRDQGLDGALLPQHSHHSHISHSSDPQPSAHTPGGALALPQEPQAASQEWKWGLVWFESPQARPGQARPFHIPLWSLSFSKHSLGWRPPSPSKSNQGMNGTPEHLLYDTAGNLLWFLNTPAHRCSRGNTQHTQNTTPYVNVCLYKQDMYVNTPTQHLSLPLDTQTSLGPPGALGRVPCSPVTVGALPGAAPARLVLGIQQDLLHVPVVDGGWNLLLAPCRH